MQKITVTFIYGKDDTRKLKYRLTGDIPIGVMLEKLIGFQFIVDSADPKTFNVLHKGIQLGDLTKTFDECEIIDGDEIYLVPTVFEPIPPLPENDLPLKKTVQKSHDRTVTEDEEAFSQTQHSTNPRQNRHSGRNNTSTHNHGGYNRRSGNQKHSGDFRQNDKNHDRKPHNTATNSQEAHTEKKDAPIPFKPHSKNYHRNHGKRPGSNTNKPN